MTSSSSIWRLAPALGLAAALVACMPADTPHSEATPEEQQIEDVSSGPTNADALHQEDLRITVQRLPRIESEGDCAPRYKNGMLGACIAGKECRGFGVRDKNGKALCTCYGLKGGCGEGQRCDDEKLACVPEGEFPGDPAEAD